MLPVWDSALLGINLNLRGARRWHHADAVQERRPLRLSNSHSHHTLLLIDYTAVGATHGNELFDKRCSQLEVMSKSSESSLGIPGLELTLEVSDSLRTRALWEFANISGLFDIDIESTFSTVS